MTTTITTSAVQDNSSLANFKAWAQTVLSAAFSTLGWTQTSDTGQVNWGTIVAVPSSTYVYEIWKAADALASSMPIFVKVEYGFSGTQVDVRITTGTASNGSGTITGQGTGTFQLCSASHFGNQGATTFPCYFSGSPGEFRAYMWAPNTPNTGSTNPSFIFIIERSKDSSGNNTADYVTVAHAQNSAATANASNQHQQSFSFTAIGRPDTGILGIGGTSQGGTGTGNAFGTVAAAPILPWVGKMGNPMLGLMTVYDLDVVDQATVTATSLYGSTHTFLSFRGSAFSSALGQRSLSGSSPMAGLMQFE